MRRVGAGRPWRRAAGSQRRLVRRRPPSASGRRRLGSLRAALRPRHGLRADPAPCPPVGAPWARSAAAFSGVARLEAASSPSDPDSRTLPTRVAAPRRPRPRLDASPPGLQGALTWWPPLHPLGPDQPVCASVESLASPPGPPPRLNRPPPTLPVAVGCRSPVAIYSGAYKYPAPGRAL